LPRNLYITARIHFIMSPGFLYLEVNLSSMCAGEAIYSGINCAFEIFRQQNDFQNRFTKVQFMTVGRVYNSLDSFYNESGLFLFARRTLSGSMHYLGSRNKFNFFLQFRQHFPEGIVGLRMRMSYSYGFAIVICNTDQLSDLYADSPFIHHMV